MTKQTSYFKVVPERQHYIGEKYFALSTDSDSVLQVCVQPGPDVRRGRTNAIGIYTITRNSFAVNYMAMGYVAPITKQQYEKHFTSMMDALKTVISDLKQPK